MARLEAQSKLLYYPTPEHIVKLIVTWFSAEKPVRLADPCCGTGDALRTFAQSLGVPAETWGIELSYSRARAALSILERVLPASFYHVTWSPNSVSLAFNNPPYDWSPMRDEHGKAIRHERLFVIQTTGRIVPGGHHVIIVPRAMLGDESLARHLAGWYERCLALRFPDPDYAAFEQVVILATGKRAEYRHPGREEIEALTSLVEAEIPALAAGDGRFTIPPTPKGDFKFVYTPTEPLDLLRAARQCSPLKSPEFQRLTYVRPVGAPFTPAMPLMIGHLTMLISGQETGVLSLTDPKTGQPFLLKGMSRKQVEADGEAEYDDEGEYSHTRVTERERHVTTLTVAHPDGRLQKLAEPGEVSRFIQSCSADIADAILTRNRPLYNFDPTEAEWKTTAQVGLGLPLLPGRERRGMFDMQRHWAVAAARVMRQTPQGAAVLNLDMGTGKTLITVGALEVLGEWPAVVMCPGHMVWKWKRELEIASNPADPIQARVITRPVRESASRWSQLCQAITEAGGTVVSTTRRQVEPATVNDPGGRRQARIACPTDKIEAVARLLNSLAFRDKDPEGRQVKIAPTIQFSGEGLQVEFVDRDEYTLFDFAGDYRSGLLGKKAVAVIAFDPAKYDAGQEEKPAVVYHWRRTWNEELRFWERRKLPTCPVCGEPFEDKIPRFCPSCHAALFNFTRWRRVGLARLVQHQFKGFFQVYVADEIHKCQDGRTDIGVADQRLLSATRYSLALTGTLFGGAAGSLFFLLYRRSPELRRLFGFREKMRFVDVYGLWERQWNQKEPLAGESGKSTGIERWNYRQRELPGVAPSVIRYLLPITLFGGIADLGYELPPVYEDVVPLEMTEPQAQQYSHASNYLLSKALELLRGGDPGGLSVWFSTSRFRPASGYRDENVAYTGRRGGSIDLGLPAVITAEQPWLPKEQRLAEMVRTDAQQGLRTLIFVEQSGTRDIRERLKNAIETLAPGSEPLLVEAPRVGVLSAGDMSPAKREAWIRLNAPRMDSLLVNPKLIETGLDLVMFSHLVFYETTTSLYVLWQSMRRVWRLGQDKPVQVDFLTYTGTVEERVLDRMGRKMKAAQLLYGKEAAGVLVEADDDDVQRQVIRDALQGKVATSAGEMMEKLRIFSTGDERAVRVSVSPSGSLIAFSHRLLVTQLPAGETVQLDLFGGAVAASAVAMRRKRR
ncbi:MAG: DUF6094 domain-containing protein [Chloroflexota bacterium]